MNQIERTMTAGDVIEFTMHDQRHTAVVMLMTDDDLSCSTSSTATARHGPASRAFRGGDLHPRTGADLVAA